MTAVLRVKRKYTDMPMDMLVIACKRPKMGSPNSKEDASAVQTVLQFAGTLKDPTEDVVEHMAKVLPKLDKPTAVKRAADSSEPANNSAAKVCKWIGVNSVIERYKVVNCQRSLEAPNEAVSMDKWMTLIDVEDSWSVLRTEQEEKKEDIAQYEYDLYYAQTSNDVWFESDEILVKHAEYQSANSEHNTSSSSDSNAESNWRNDYPDDDPDASTDDAYNSDCSDVYNDDDYLYGDSRGNEDAPYRYSYNHRRTRFESERSDSYVNVVSDDEERLSRHDSNESLGIL